MQNSSMKMWLVILAVAVVAVGGYAILTMPDDRTVGEKIGDAADQLGEGNLDNAARELQDRTPAERIGDAVNDAAN